MTPEKVVEVQKYGREPISLHTPARRGRRQRVRRPHRGLRGRRPRRRGELHAPAGAAAPGAGHALRARGRRRVHAVRPDRRPAEDARRDRQGLRRHARADPPDRVQDDVEAAPPVAARRSCATTSTEPSPTPGARPGRAASRVAGEAARLRCVRVAVESAGGSRAPPRTGRSGPPAWSAGVAAAAPGVAASARRRSAPCSSRSRSVSSCTCGRELAKLRGVLAGVVRAEEELAHGQQHADVGLRAAAVAAVGCGQRVQVVVSSHVDPYNHPGGRIPRPGAGGSLPRSRRTRPSLRATRGASARGPARVRGRRPADRRWRATTLVAS